MREYSATTEPTENLTQLEEIVISDVNEAEEYISQVYEKGMRPVVSVPREYIDALKAGLRAHASWIAGVSLLVGTIGRDPYLPRGQERVLVRVSGIERDAIRPRFTGPDNAFHGVVALNGPIDHNQFQVLA